MKRRIEIEIECKEHEFYVMTNSRGDTFSYNPTKGVGEELDSFFHGAKNINLPPDIPEFIPRCCGRCDGVNEPCYTDMECDDHNKEGCEICYGPRMMPNPAYVI